MRRLPIMVNKPVRVAAKRYRPGVARMADQAELAESCIDIVEAHVLASRKIGSARVVGARYPDPAG